MKCPSCGAVCPEGALECASCGVIFAKLEERRKREKAEAAEALARLNAPASQPFDLALGKRIAAGALVIWAALMARFILQEMTRKKAAALQTESPGPGTKRNSSPALSATGIPNPGAPIPPTPLGQ